MFGIESEGVVFLWMLFGWSWVDVDLKCVFGYIEVG